MKAILVAIGLCLAATAVKSMPLPALNANKPQSTITVADGCGDRCGLSYSRLPFRGRYDGGYVTVRDPLIQRRPFCPLGSYVACIGSGMFCVDLCY
ncbi:MAG TPA: hypothetical protein VFL53_01130 [Pseudolabrys sp.]|nr:hypothetical protein [Pseudolabrys sp.]